MQLKYLKTIQDAQDHINRVSGIAWSSNHKKLAVATADRSIVLFDDALERRDKFSTKPNDPANGKTSYTIRAVAFSPDSTRLAVAQSDNIVYVYKLGTEWNDKKIICNKFPQTTSVTAMIWLAMGPIVAGLEDGKVRALNTKTNKSQNLFAADHMVVSLACNAKGTGFLSGHDDGTVVRFFVADELGQASGRMFGHSTSPVALAWTHAGAVAAGCDKKIVFYDTQGRHAQTFDYSRDDNEREFMTAASSPNGQSVAIGSFDRIRVFAWSTRQNAWSEPVKKEIQNLYSITSIAWRRDGARLVLGSVCGAVLVFESVLRRTIWQDKFEITYIAPSQVLLKSMQDASVEPLIVESKLGLEIEDIRIMGKDSYLVGRTDDSLILCDLTRNLTSELPWTASGRNERFYFENPNVCLVFNAGELTLVEYGENYILGSVRTEFVNPHVISVRLNERGATKDNKKLAYLMDQKTICVLDLLLHITIAQITHDSKIDWLELSETAHKLLFRDKKMRLILVDIASGKKQTLLGKISFVQWVMQSDVAIAQSEDNLAVWYNIDMPELVTLMPVRGEVVEVEREEGRTEVMSREGVTEHVYRLDEGLVEFGTAVNDCDFGRAVLFLESLGDKLGAKAMWHNLANVALAHQNLRIAQRCYAALGNASKTFYLSEMMQIADEYEKTHGPGVLCPEIQARFFLLNGDLKSAERIYLEYGDIESALKMYTNLRRWDDAIKLAERRGYSHMEQLRADQMSYLLSSGQEEQAGQVLEERGEPDQAMSLYMKAGKTSRAARLALKMPHLMQDEQLMQRVTSALVRSDLFELAGDLSHRMHQPEAAIEMYRRGGAYARAIELARNVSPEEVTVLEEEWGDWLVSKRQMDASISHYIEAGVTVKALDAAVAAKQFRKALQIAKVVDDPDEIKKYGQLLADHLSKAGDIEGAEDMLVRAGQYREAVDLLNQNGLWERAYDLAEKYLGTTIVREMFVEMAAKLEEQAKYRDAEKVLLAINEPDMAISMYKRLEQYDAMIRLVERFHKDLVQSTHLHLARQLETKLKYKLAEVHFLAAGDWKAAVHMYCNANKWEDAHRVAKQKGTEGASNQVAYMWSRSMSIDGAARLLTKMGLVETALMYACEASQFDFALDLCRKTGKSADEVHLKMAMELEDEGKFVEAEAEFLLANKPKEAILMHTHSRDWRSAVRIAEMYLPEAVNEVLLSQAAEALEARNYQEYEALLIRAERPDVILQHYKEYEMWNDAIRIAREYVPAALSDVQRQQSHAQRVSATASNSRELLQQASEFARNEQFRRAADCLLLINAENADQASVERALLRAAEICNQFLDGVDALEVARELGPRLLELNHIGPAAHLYLAADMPKDAVDVFIQSDNWGKARRLAKEIDADMVAYVETQQKSRLRMEGNVEQLADIDIVGALDLLAEQGQWTRCIEKAKQHSTTMHHKYMALYATQLIRDGDCLAALALYMKNGAPPLPQNYNIYHRITLECFAMREQDAAVVWKDLRSFLYELVQAIRSAESKDTVNEDRFDQLLLIAHYYATRSACREISALHSIGLKISIALLRYTELIPVDKGYFEAGMDLRTAGRDSEAFVLLNHYLDVCDAIDGAENLVDHLNLAATDFPSSVPIPETMHLRNEMHLHEDIRDWILAISMDQKVDQVLPTDERNMYDASLGLSDVPCIVCGYPVMGKPPITFQRSHRQANRDSWSKLTVAAKMGPHTGVPDIIAFIEKWCGSANFITN